MDDFKKARARHIGVGGIKCRCCNKYHTWGNHKKKKRGLSKLSRLKLKRDLMIQFIDDGIIKPLIESLYDFKGERRDMEEITGEMVKNAMIENDITKVDHHQCGICNFMVYYSRTGEQLYFEPHCDCLTRTALSEPRGWSEPADWINMQSNAEIKNKIAKRFGIVLEK